MNVTILALWDVTVCSVGDGYICFGVTCCSCGIVCSQDGTNRLLRNVCKHIPDYCNEVSGSIEGRTILG